MIVRCPQCEFSRTISAHKIPPTAEVATCPKCKYRFRFRTLDPEERLAAEKALGAAAGLPEDPAGTGGANPQAGREQRLPKEPPKVTRVEEIEPGEPVVDIWDAMDSLHRRWESQLEKPLPLIDEEPEPVPQETPAQDPAPQDPVPQDQAPLADPEEPEPLQQFAPETCPAPQARPVPDQARSAPQARPASEARPVPDQARSAPQARPASEARSGPETRREPKLPPEQKADAAPQARSGPEPARGREPQAEQTPRPEPERSPAPSAPEARPAPESELQPEQTPRPEPGSRLQPERPPFSPLPSTAGAPFIPESLPFASTGKEKTDEAKTFPYSGKSEVPPEERVERDLLMLKEDVQRPCRDLGRLDDSFARDAAAGPSFAGPESAEADVEVPWENPARHGWFKGFMRTVNLVLFNGPQFFEGLGPSGGMTPGYLFFLAIGYLGILFSLLWGHAGAVLMGAPAFTQNTRRILPVLLLLAPFALGLVQLFLTGSIRLAAQLNAPDRAQFSRVFRLTSYAVAPLFFCVIPFIGPIVGVAWFLVCLMMGCRYCLRLSWPVSVLAPLPPALLMVGVVYLYFR